MKEDPARARERAFREWMGVQVVVACLLLAACGSSGPRFKSTDITGADWGRDFSLTDTTGKTRTLADFRGKVVVLFFGYIFCPDVCPTTLFDLKQVIDRLGADGRQVQVLNVTVDPERDTPELLGRYVATFDPSFIGLYGDLEQTRKVAKEFKVFFQKVPGPTPGSYSVDHTAGSYVFDPQGRLRLFVTYGAAANLVDDIRLLLSGA